MQETGPGLAAVLRPPLPPKPNGHTLRIGIVDIHASNPSAYRSLQDDLERAFAPVSIIGRFPFAIVVGPSTPNIPSSQELVAAARPNP